MALRGRSCFPSFVEEDLDPANLFRGQAENENLDLGFDDYPVKEPRLNLLLMSHLPYKIITVKLFTNKNGYVKIPE